MRCDRTGRSLESRLGSKPKMMDRRDFLKLSGAGLAAVALLGSVRTVFAQEKKPSPGSAIVAEFKEAAEEYGVSMELLMAMGYANTRWEMPPPGANVYAVGDPHGWGSYGIMALAKNPSSNTLGEASRLTGIPEEVLKTDRAEVLQTGASATTFNGESVVLPALGAASEIWGP
jgi:TAT (twin-arginine translocation) pathway-exported protein